MPYKIEFRWYDSKVNEFQEVATATAALKLVDGLTRSDARVVSVRAPGGHEVQTHELKQLADSESDGSSGQPAKLA